MIKVIVKYFLSLCILLLSGYSQLSAHTYKESALNDIKASEHTNFGAVKHDQAFIIKSLPSGSEKKIQIEAAENEAEEDDLATSKKYFVSNNYFATVFFALLLGYFCQVIKGRFHFFTHFFNTLSNKRYILFQVIKI